MTLTNLQWRHIDFKEKAEEMREKWKNVLKSLKRNEESKERGIKEI